jgi:hypothetical protein
MLDRTAPAALAGISHNHPPAPIIETAIERARASFHALNDWLRGRSKILDQDMATNAKALVDRANGSLRSMEEERDARVRPLNEQVRAINASYKPARTQLEGVRDSLVDHLTDYAKRLEAERLAIAEAARKEAQAAAEAAIEAERLANEAYDDAGQGVCDIDLDHFAEQADRSISAMALAARVAQRAQRDTKVRIGGGFDRVMTLKTKEILTVTDWKAAIDEMGLTDGIADAILTAARAYRKAFGDLPAGITVTNERSL